MRLVRLVKVHYLVPQLAQPVLVQCLRLMEQHLKVQMVVLDRRAQELVDSKVLEPVDPKAQELVDGKVLELVDPKDLPLQQVKVVHRQHRHSIHSSDSLQKLMQLTDPQGLDQIMEQLPQQAPDQIMAPVPQQVAEVHSDEASLTSQLHRLMVLRGPQQIMLMEVALKHLRYSVVSSPHQQKMMHRVQEHKVQQAEHKVRELEHSRDQAHLMVLHQ